MPDFQFYFELIGAVAFAVSGAALAVKKGMDLFGVAVMGMTTAVGGGILRDMLLGLTPPAALKDPLQALVAIATSLLLFIVWKKWHPSGNHRVWESVLLAADSLGLGIFSVHGAAVAIRAGYGANVFLVLLVGVVYIASRSLGKIGGAYASCRATKCSPSIQKYLGITLLPQAGVALGMAAEAAQLSDGHMVRNVVLFSVLVYELVGPTLTRMALTAAGEIRPEGRTNARVENKPEKPVSLS